MKRSIRLKEYAPNQEKVVFPSLAQIEQCSDLHEGGYKLITDQNGFIVSGNDFFSDKKTIILGDSFVESTFVGERSRFCSVLERLGADGDVSNIGQVLNAGVSGSTSLNLLNIFINKVVPIKPSLVIFVIPSNDSQVHRFSDTYWNDSEYYANIIPPGKLNSVGDFYNNLVKGDCVKILNLFADACNIFDIKLAFATCPYASLYDGSYMFQKYKNKSWFDSNIVARKILNDKLRSISYMRKIIFLDFEHEIGGDNKLFYDDLHLNEIGSQRIAKFIFEKIQNIY